MACKFPHGIEKYVLALSSHSFHSINLGESANVQKVLLWGNDWRKNELWNVSNLKTKAKMTKDNSIHVFAFNFINLSIVSNWILCDFLDITFMWAASYGEKLGTVKHIHTFYALRKKNYSLINTVKKCTKKIDWK